MSNSKKIRSKRRYRVARNRKQRTNGKVVTVDFETRCPMELGTRLHREIERVLGDAHASMNHELLMAYATMVPAETVALYGGDLFDGVNLMRGPDAQINRDGKLYSVDYKLAQEVLDDAMRAMLRPVKTKEDSNDERDTTEGSRLETK